MNVFLDVLSISESQDLQFGPLDHEVVRSARFDEPRSDQSIAREITSGGPLKLHLDEGRIGISGSVILQPSDDDHRFTTTPPPPPSRDPMIGQRIGGYVVATPLGAGGMGKVYLLVHPGSPGRLRRVLKVLHEDVANRHPELKERFLLEARAAASLDHPNIIEIHDYACFPDGVPYLVMAFLDGVDLGEHVARAGARSGHPGRISFEMALPLLLQVCAALRVAHAHGIIHRDLKPSNAFVVTGDDERERSSERSSPRVVLLDFGIAKVLDPELRQRNATQSRAVLGTPGYMAPEQARGQPVDHRTDIYAFGVLAYEILTGRRPFDGATPEDLAIQQVTTTPPAPAALVRGIPDEVSELILRCLAPTPARRPGTISEVAHVLIHVLPNGRDVAREAAKDLLSPLAIAGPTEPTFLHAPVAGAIDRTIPTAASHGSRRRAAWLALAATCAIGVVLLASHLRTDGDASDEVAGTAGSAFAPAANVPDAGDAQAAARALAPDAGSASASAVADTGTMREVAPVAAPARVVEPTPTTTSPAAPIPSRSAAEKPAAARITQPPQQGSGELEVFVQPWADLWLDGKYLSQTPFRRTLPAGRYQLRLANEDSGKSENIEITVKADRTTTIRRMW
jgi:eukaryotic-like serine/threonine-protein kinase